ncbi:MAG: cyclodeaminase/cyclohydrolase family protein [Phycisphaerae bacterium]|jgi:formiminotetrahydrofolate cyclodeaminase
MDDLAKLAIDDFLDRTGDRTPTPGGGGVTGLCGALAGALARMVASYSVNKKTDPAVRDRLDGFARRFHRADQLLRALITRDAEAYAVMARAGRERKQAGERSEGNDAAEETYQRAVLAALAVPMEMAALVSDALATMDEFKSSASRYLLSDLGIAAVLAEATARAARYTVRVNVRELGDGSTRAHVLEEIDEIVGHCAGRRESVEAFASKALE